MKVYTHPEYDYVKVVEVPNEEIEKIDLCMCEQPKETLGSFYSRQDTKPDVLINAGFFATTTGASCFNIVDDGEVFSEHEKYKWGMGITAEHKKLQYGSIAMNSYYKFVDFLSGYPNLVDNGVACSPWTFATEINYNAYRSMIGYNDTTTFFVTVGSPGMQFTKMAQLMIGIGCKYAINLDGGGSSRLMVEGEVVNTPSENRAVDSVFALWLTEEARDAYRKEVGLDNDEYYFYTVKSGDSWWSIASSELGSGFEYLYLMEYNNATSSTTLHPGDKIKIPKNIDDDDEENETPTPDDKPTEDNPSTDPEQPSDEPTVEIPVKLMYNPNDKTINFIREDNSESIFTIAMPEGLTYLTE